ncbi:DUF4307 domain-containing protein [Sphaerisporangium melleum]|uniref:DUF4307 domain-containing protein n=1 Tax=Sphaerisporangium melleum TaxID=321316 RepID=UPI001E2B0873|nr:DUF4307 domain-containing protein [Sphaerisporangium melleum]
MDQPILGTPDSFPERSARSGRVGRTIAFVVIGIFIAIAMGGWGYVMMAAKGNTDVLTIAFTVDGPNSITITFQAHKPADRTAVCRLRATDVDHVEVGTRDVTIPPGEEDVRLTERVDTTARATSGHVQHCYLVQ